MIRVAAALALAACLAACSTPSVSPTTDASALPAVEPERPYDAEAILDAMRASRRPGGVPDTLETDAIASAVAAQLWTWSGEPWPTLTIGGACGPERCSLDVAGTPPGAAGEDLYQLEVTDGAVTLLGSQLQGYPPELDSALDAIARDGARERLDGLVLQGVRWLPPPDAGRFVLSYRSGGEEGSPAADVTVDLATHSIVELR